MAEQVVELPPLRGAEIVIGVDRGGLEVAAACARALRLPCHRCSTRHLGLPWRPPLPFGAVTDDGYHFVDAEVAADHALAPSEIAALVRSAREAAGFSPPRRPSLAGRSVLIVGDALSTGYRALAVAASVKAAGPADVTIVAPCCAADAVARVAAEGIRLVSLHVADGPRFDADSFYDRRSAAAAA